MSDTTAQISIGIDSTPAKQGLTELKSYMISEMGKIDAKVNATVLRDSVKEAFKGQPFTVRVDKKDLTNEVSQALSEVSKRYFKVNIDATGIADKVNAAIQKELNFARPVLIQTGQITDDVRSALKAAVREPLTVSINVLGGMAELNTAIDKLNFKRVFVDLDVDADTTKLKASIDAVLLNPSDLAINYGKITAKLKEAVEAGLAGIQTVNVAPVATGAPRPANNVQTFAQQTQAMVAGRIPVAPKPPEAPSAAALLEQVQDAAPKKVGSRASISQSTRLPDGSRVSTSKPIASEDAQSLIALSNLLPNRATQADGMARLKREQEALRVGSASNIDANTLLGLPSRDATKSFGSQIAAQMRDGVKQEAQAQRDSNSNLRARTTSERYDKRQAGLNSTFAGTDSAGPLKNLENQIRLAEKADAFLQERLAQGIAQRKTYQQAYDQALSSTSGAKGSAATEAVGRLAEMRAQRATLQASGTKLDVGPSLQDRDKLQASYRVFQQNQASKFADLDAAFAGLDKDPVAKARMQLGKVTAAQRLLDQGMATTAANKLGPAVVAAAGQDGTVARLKAELRDALEAREAERRRAAAPQQRFAEVRAAARANARETYTGDGVALAGVRAVVDAAGGDKEKARQFLPVGERHLLESNRAMAEYVRQVPTATAHTDQFRGALNDAHSAARGFAGSLGQIWMTWGSTAPLVGAAALGAGLKAVYQNGKDVENQLLFVAALTGEQQISMSQLSGALTGSSIGPKEAGEGLRALAQNGLSTREALSALPEVLNLAVVGEMKLADAALGATGVMSAFNLGLSDIGRVSDVFSKAAAMSNTSVGGMVEAMKQASTVADSYGVSLEETAATLATMAKRNIEGSAAGTAMRNMMKELATPSKQAKDAIDALGIKAYDSGGKLKSYGDLLQEVKSKTSTLNEQSKLAYLDRIFGERGGKAINALLSDMDVYGRTLDELKNKAKGFTDSVAEMLSGGTDKRAGKLAATFQTSTAEVFAGFKTSGGDQFAGIKTSIDTILLTLNNAFASEGFKTGLSEISQAVASFTLKLVDNAKVIGDLVGGWLAYRAAILAGSLATSAASAITLAYTSIVSGSSGVLALNTTAQAANATAGGGLRGALAGLQAMWAVNSAAVTTNTGVTVAATGAATTATAATTGLRAALMTTAVALGPLTILAGALGAAYLLLKDHTSEAEKQARLLDEANQSLIDNFNRTKSTREEELNYLDRRNKLMARGYSIKQAEGILGGTVEGYASVQILEKQYAKDQAAAQKARQIQDYLPQGSAAAPGTLPEEETEAASLEALNRARKTRADGIKLKEDGEKRSAEDALAKLREQADAFNEQVRFFVTNNPMAKGKQTVADLNGQLVQKDVLAKDAALMVLPSERNNLSADRLSAVLKEQKSRLDSFGVDKVLPSVAAAAAKENAEVEAARRASQNLEKTKQLRQTQIEEVNNRLKQRESQAEVTRVSLGLGSQAADLDNYAPRNEAAFQTAGSLTGIQTTALATIKNGGLRKNMDPMAFVQKVNDLQTTATGEDELLKLIEAEMDPAFAKTKDGKAAWVKVLADSVIQFNKAGNEITLTQAQVELRRVQAQNARDQTNIKDVNRSENETDRAEDFAANLETMVPRKPSKMVEGYAAVAAAAAEAQKKQVDKEVERAEREIGQALDSLDIQIKQSDALAYRAQQNADKLIKEANRIRATEPALAAVLDKNASDQFAFADSQNVTGASLRSDRDKRETSFSRIRPLGTEAKDRADSNAKDSIVDNFLKKEEKNPTDALNPQGKAMLEISNALREQIKLQQEYSDAVKAAGDSEADLNKLRAKNAALSLGGFANMIGASRSFVKEGSKDYDRLMRVEKMYRLAQGAMSNEWVAGQLGDLGKWLTGKMATLGASLTAEAAAGAAEVGIEGTTQAAKTGLTGAGETARNLLKIPGVFLTFMSQMGPWGWAAAAAAVAAVGFAASGGGGKTEAAKTNDGTGSVLGDVKDKNGNYSLKSESLTKSIDALADIDSLTMRYSADMAASLRNIAGNISGLSALIVRTGGLSGATAGIKVGGGNYAKEGAAAGAVIGAGFGGLMGAAVGGLVGGILGALSSRRTSIVGNGIQQNRAQTLSDIAAGGFDGGYYADVRTKKKTFGITTSDKTRRNAIDDAGEVDQQFGLILNGFADTVRTAAGPLKMNLAEVSGRLNDYVVDLGAIDLNGLTGTQINEKLQAVFGKAADDIAKAAIPGLEAFQQVGQGYYEAVIRVATGTEAANRSLRRLGVTAVDLQSIVNKQGAVDAEQVRDSLRERERSGDANTNGLTQVGNLINKMSGSGDDIATAYRALIGLRAQLRATGVDGESLTSTMIEGAGSLDALKTGFDSYAKNFETPAKRLKRSTAELGVDFAALGYALPTTKKGFTDLVESLDLNTEADQYAYGALMNLNGQVADFIDLTKEAAKAKAFDTLKAKILELESTSKKVTFYSGSIFGQEIDLSYTTRVQNSIAKIMSEFEGTPEELMSAYTGLVGVRQVLTLLGKDSENMTQGMVDAAGGIDALVSATASYEKDFLTTVQRQGVEVVRMSKAFGLLGVTMPKSREGFTALLKSIDTTTPAGEELFAQVMLLSGGFASLTESIESASKSIESEIKRIRKLIAGDSDSSYASLQTKFAVTTAKARAGDSEALGELPQLSQDLLAAADKYATSSVDLARVQARTANSLQQTIDIARANAAVAPTSDTIPGFASGGYHDGGWRIVGENGPELEATGPARYFNASETQGILSGGRSDGGDSMVSVIGSLNAEISSLRDEVATLRQEQRGQSAAMVREMGTTNQILYRSTRGGNAMVVEFAA